MVVDTSALVAVLQGETGSDRLAELIASADRVRLSAATLVEASIVVQTRLGDAGQLELDALLARARVEIVPVDAEQADAARAAFRRFGKGRHPAALNFGDCFAYALAVVLGEPLLYVGEDFPKTDVLAALT